jgi:preprotein translocase subunit SecD
MWRVTTGRAASARRALGVASAVMVFAFGAAPAAAEAAKGGRTVTIVLTPNSPRADSEKVGGLLALRLDKIGIDATVEPRGDDLVVRMHGVTEQRALDMIGLPALRFRPVLADLPASDGSGDPTAAAQAVKACDAAALVSLGGAPITAPADDRSNVCIVAPMAHDDFRLLLGPASVGGADVKAAKAQFQFGNGFVVTMNLTKRGLEKFNHLAATSYGRPSPNDQVAVTLQGSVESNPAFQTSSFDGPIQITGGSNGFTQKEAETLAAVINLGASTMANYEVASVTAA